MLRSLVGSEMCIRDRGVAESAEKAGERLREAEAAESDRSMHAKYHRRAELAARATVAAGLKLEMARSRSELEAMSAGYAAERAKNARAEWRGVLEQHSQGSGDLESGWEMVRDRREIAGDLETSAQEQEARAGVSELEVKAREAARRRLEDAARRDEREDVSAKEDFKARETSQVAQLERQVETARVAAATRAEEQERKRRHAGAVVAAKKVVKVIGFDVGYSDVEMKRDHKKMRADAGITAMTRAELMAAMQQRLESLGKLQHESSETPEMPTEMPASVLDGAGSLDGDA
eukprot:TRINITY_DN27283_c0_g1_i2.p1 TRINITY_DN27283_c0_g1~~TRINITY_DN27283_c0_g1_i2.p1  ORF type:complete len:330 (+),score=107.55 TRINITY_DN27283_c0_g1_i2:115-990(+)